MKKRIVWFFVLMFLCSVLSVVFIANADQPQNEKSVTCTDLVETDDGTVEFKKIYSLFDRYNINKRSDTIDTVNTIDKVLVLGTTSSNTVFTFKTHLNRDYLTKYFNIVEWFIVPAKLQPYGEPNWGAEYADSDFESFEITVRDVNNPEKYVIFRTTNRPDSASYCTKVSGRAGANGQSVEGVLQSEPDQIEKNWGTGLKASHVGAFSNGDGVPEGFDPNLPLGGFVSLDYETKQVFSVTGEDRGKRVMVRDLDDGKYMVGTDVPWEGFDSKELEVSIRFVNIVSGRTAQVAILGFNGMDFTKGKVIDNSAPEVLENTELDEATLYGEVGKAMPILDCYAYDLLDGFISDVSYSVYYNYGKSNQEEKEISDGKFTPEKSGTYSIVATVSDRFGNIGKHVREVDIRKIINDLHLELSEELPSVCNVGERIGLPSAFVYGGSVNKRYKVSVLFEGQNIEIDSDNGFVPLKQGLYTVRYAVTDYYSVPEFFDYAVVARIGDAPIVSFPEIREVVETGVKFNIPEFSAVDYSSFGVGVAAKLSFAVKEPASDVYTEVSDDYVPQREGAYKFKITASCVTDDEKAISKEYDFFAKNCRFVRDYFVTDGVSVIEQNRDMAFSVTDKNGTFYFINPIINSGVSLGFTAENGSDYPPVITITLSDSTKKGNVVSLRIEKTGSEKSVLSCADGSATINGAVGDGKAGFDISYSNGWIYDGNKAVIKLKNYDNGKEFDGFDSGKVYVGLAVANSVGETLIKFSGFCGNQDFDYNADDITEPTVVYSDLSRICRIGEEVSFTYGTFDLFDTECEISARVNFNGKTLSVGRDGKCSFVATGFGKYTVAFRASDKFGNETSSSFNIYCYDNIAPTINVVKGVSGSYKLGKTVTLPSAETNDNVDTDLSYSIYARKPAGSFVIIENAQFTPDVKGDWKIYYYTVDSCGNYAVVVFDVSVS